MNYTHVIASGVLAVCDTSTSLIDTLEADTLLSISDRTWLGVYQAKIAAGNTRKDEDMRFIDIFRNWLLNLHKF